MTNPPTDERREAFDAWAQSKGYDIAKEYGLYRRDNTTAAFDGYQAALSHQGEVPYIARQVLNTSGNWVDALDTGPAIDAMIDFARSKTVDGGGA